jgi:hypothetical protein
MAAVALTPVLTGLAAEPADSPRALRSDAFLASIGIGVHMEYTDGAYANETQAIVDLDYLGIHQLRDETPNPKGGIPYRHYRDAITALVTAGNRFAFVVGAVQPIAVSLRQIEEIEAAHPGAVIAIEGPNEINNFPVKYAGLGGDAAGRAFQRDLYAAVKSNPVLHHLPVYYFTGGGKIDLSEQRNLADYATAHPYPYRGEAPGPPIANNLNTLFPKPFPRVVTETGYYNQPTNPYGSGVDDATQAKLTLDLLLSTFAQGVAKTYLYQLRTAYRDPDGKNTDAEYGLFNLNNAPKPVARAIHNLTTMLAGHGHGAFGFEPGWLRYTLNGLPRTGNSLLLQKPDGVFALVIWAEPVIWDESMHRPVAPPTAMVTASLNNTARSVQVFDPLLGVAPIQMHRETGTVAIDVSDHPIVVEITP